MTDGSSFRHGAIGLACGLVTLELGSLLFPDQFVSNPTHELLAIGVTILGFAIAILVPAWYWIGRTRTRPRIMFFGALSLPILFTAYLALLGYDGIFTTDWRPMHYFYAPVNSLPFAVLLILLAFLGATVGEAVRRRLTVTLGVVVLGVVAIPPLGAVGGEILSLHTPGYGSVGVGAGYTELSAFVPFVVFGSLVSMLLACSEYVARYPGRVKETLPTRVVSVGVLVGVVHLTLVVVASLYASTRPELSSIFFDFAASESAFGYVVLGGTLIGLILLGAVPAVLIARWRIVTPAVVVSCLLSYFLYGTAQRMTPPIPWTGRAAPPPIDAYAGFWFVLLAIAVVFGAVEHRFRLWRDDSPPLADGDGAGTTDG